MLACAPAARLCGKSSTRCAVCTSNHHFCCLCFRRRIREADEGATEYNCHRHQQHATQQNGQASCIVWPIQLGTVKQRGRRQLGITTCGNVLTQAPAFLTAELLSTHSRYTARFWKL